MISIAHHEFRGQLIHKAREMGLLGPDRSLKKALHAVYPMGIEETLKKLADAALKNGIAGIVAYTAFENRRMTRLFKGLPYKVNTASEDGMLALSCKFEKRANKTS